MRHAWHLYQIAVPSRDGRPGRTALARALKADEIGTSVHFKPLHLFPWYQERLGLRTGQYRVAETCYEESLSLPIWPDMTDRDLQRVVSALESVLGPAIR